MLINNSLRLAVVALLLMLGAVACSGGNADNTETNDTARPTEQTDTGLRSTASNYEIEGPITSIVNSQSFFLGSTLVIHDSSTRFEYGNANDLAVGRRVEVEASRITPGTATAREIEFKDGDYDDDYEGYYEIEGAITSIVDSRSFFLGNTLITHDSSTRFEYGNANDLAVGRRVEVEGSRTSSGTIIAREIEFEYTDYDDDYEGYYEIEGAITSIVDSRSFFLGNTLITHDSSTRFEYGNANDLAVGRRVEVEGSRASSGTITAREIEFEDGEYDDDYYHNNGDDDDNYYDDYYEIEGRITSIVDSQSFLLGSTLVIHNSSTRFEYGNANDLAVGRRVEVEGTRIGSATIIAREIEFEYD